jgi:23S rRNA (adenine-N6)-dimethyltransferase
MAQPKSSDSQTATPLPRGRTARDQRRRVLSQNFLGDEQAIDRLINLAGISKNDLVIEIGAGRGVITKRLVGRARRVLAYEVDPELVDHLRAIFRTDSLVEVVDQDAVANPAPSELFKAIGNLPFSRTSEIVRWSLSARYLQSATYITQREFARKRTGEGGRWSRLTVMTWPKVEWRYCGVIPRTSFRPQPTVDAAILQVVRRSQPMLKLEELRRYAALVELGFRGIGGSLFRSLCTRYVKASLRLAFDGAGIGPDTVVAWVTPEQWIRLFRNVEQLRPRAPRSGSDRTRALQSDQSRGMTRRR